MNTNKSLQIQHDYLNVTYHRDPCSLHMIGQGSGEFPVPWSIWERMHHCWHRHWQNLCDKKDSETQLMQGLVNVAHNHKNLSDMPRDCCLGLSQWEHSQAGHGSPVMPYILLHCTHSYTRASNTIPFMPYSLFRKNWPADRWVSLRMRFTTLESDWVATRQEVLR